MREIDLKLGDCLLLTKDIPDGSVDLILCDPPYGTMNGAKLDGWHQEKTSWDLEIDPQKIIEIANRVLRKNGKMILFSQEPYSTKLIDASISNLSFDYRLIWEKDHFANSLIAKKAPVNYFEEILVFSKQYDIEGIHPLREYFKNIMDYIGLNLKQINSKLGHRKAEHSFYVSPKKAIIDKIGQKADHVFRLGSTQFGLCTEETYIELINAFDIDKMEEFKTYQELKEKGVALDPPTTAVWGGKELFVKDPDGNTILIL